MSEPLPKEQQSAYQRWEMASFNDAPTDKAAVVPSVSSSEQAAIRVVDRSDQDTEPLDAP